MAAATPSQVFCFPELVPQHPRSAGRLVHAPLRGGGGRQGRGSAVALEGAAGHLPSARRLGCMRLRAKYMPTKCPGLTYFYKFLKDSQWLVTEG